jgi:hypothetical protein
MNIKIYSSQATVSTSVYKPALNAEIAEEYSPVPGKPRSVSAKIASIMDKPIPPEIRMEGKGGEDGRSHQGRPDPS